MFLVNREGNQQFNINPDWYKNRKPGISAFLRIKNEEEFIKPCILSIAPFFDEIVVAINRSTDNTKSILESLKMDKIKIYEYPFQLHPNGPTHKQCPPNSLKDNSYYYNWTLSKTTYTHACKWDGDMVALSILNRLKPKILEFDKVSIRGLNMAGKNFNHLSKHKPSTAPEPRFFRVTPNSFYVQGPLCEVFRGPGRNHVVGAPVFLHFKNVKDINSAAAIWPDNWSQIPLFRKLAERRDIGNEYKGEMPEVLKELRCKK